MLNKKYWIKYGYNNQLTIKYMYTCSDLNIELRTYQTKMIIKNITNSQKSNFIEKCMKLGYK